MKPFTYFLLCLLFPPLLFLWPFIIMSQGRKLVRSNQQMLQVAQRGERRLQRMDRQAAVVAEVDRWRTLGHR